MKKITIGLFIDTYFPVVDGVCMVVDNYAKRLSKFADVIVFAPGFKDKPYDDSKFEYKVVRCKSIKIPTVDYYLPVPNLDKKFKKELNNSKLDIIHIHSPFTLGKIGVKYAEKHNIPVIGTMHSQYKQDFKRAFKSDFIASKLTNIPIKVFNKCDECWAVNSEVARIFHNDYGYKTLPRVMNNATDMEYIKLSKEDKKLIDKKYDIKDDDKVFLFVGRINKLKNVFFIVDSLKILKEKGYRFKMLFVGNGQDEKELQNYIIKNNLDKEIKLCGKITDRNILAKYYSRADLFLFPSLYDSSSIVQIEAASQKTPSLFLKGAATADTIKNNVNGFICDNDVKKYSDKIIEIMNDKKLFNKVCDNAYKEVYVNWNDRIKEVYDLYLEFINNR